MKEGRRLHGRSRFKPTVEVNTDPLGMMDGAKFVNIFDSNASAEEKRCMACVIFQPVVAETLAATTSVVTEGVK